MAIVEAQKLLCIAYWASMLPNETLFDAMRLKTARFAASGLTYDYQPSGVYQFERRALNKSRL